MGGLYSRSCRGSNSSKTVLGSPDLEMAMLTRSWWLNMVAVLWQLWPLIKEHTSVLAHRRYKRSLAETCPDFSTTSAALHVRGAHSNGWSLATDPLLDAESDERSAYPQIMNVCLSTPRSLCQFLNCDCPKCHPALVGAQLRSEYSRSHARSLVSTSPSQIQTSKILPGD